MITLNHKILQGDQRFLYRHINILLIIMISPRCRFPQMTSVQCVVSSWAWWSTSRISSAKVHDSSHWRRTRLQLSMLESIHWYVRVLLEQSSKYTAQALQIQNTKNLVQIFHNILKNDYASKRISGLSSYFFFI